MTAARAGNAGSGRSSLEAVGRLRLAALVGVLAAGAALAIAGCQAPASNLTIYAASSLKAALAKAVEAYDVSHPGTTTTVSTDSSAALATKIQQAAPVDLFLAADTANPQRLVDLGLASGGITVFATNRLTVVVPHGNPAGIERIEDLARPGVKVVAAAESVPISTYANQLIQNVNGSSDADRGFAAGCAANVVSREDNVAAVLAKVELGEGDAAIVYVTDATSSTKVDTIPVPDALDPVATYGGVVVKASTNQSGAAAFLAWLAGPDGAAILTTFGFGPPR
jgi:molybdate transport system substrate-binding protein